MSSTYERLTITDGTLHIDGLSLKAGSRQLIHNSELVLAVGHRYGIVGRNGLGKSSLLHAIYPHLQSSKTTLLISQSLTTQTDCDVDDTIVNVVLRANEERYALQQDLRTAESILDTDTASERALARYNEIHAKLRAIGADRAEADVKRTLHGLGFTDLNRPFNEFSGGWKRRVLLARALYLEPEILLADEITNDLDLAAVSWLAEHLATKWKGTLIVVSHNIAFMNTVCTDIIAFERAPIPLPVKDLTDFQKPAFVTGCKLQTYKGNYTRYKNAIDKSYPATVKSWATLEKQYSELRKNNKSKEATALLQKRAAEGILRPEKDKHISVAFQSLAAITSSALCELTNVSLTYASTDTTTITDINLRINADARITIVGANGTGKSTLLRAIIGDPEINVSKGIITKNGALKIHYYNQSTVDTLPPDHTAIQYLREIYNVAESTVRRVLGCIGLEGKTHTIPIRELSGGQRVRVALAGFQLAPAHLLIFDEITNHLDIDAIEAVIAAVNEFEGAVIIVSHDAQLITDTKCTIWLTADGTVREYTGDITELNSETDL